VMVNGSDEALAFAPPGDFPWRLLIDSADSARDANELVGNHHILAAHGAAIMAAIVGNDR